MVVQMRSQGTVVERLETLIAGSSGQMVRPHGRPVAPVVQTNTAETVVVVDAEPEPTKLMSSDKALDVAVIAHPSLSTGQIRQAVKATGWKVRKLLSAGDSSTDWVVSYVASKLGIESMVIPAEVGDDRQEMLFWFSDAVIIVPGGRDTERFERIAAEAARQGKLVSLWGTQ